MKFSKCRCIFLLGVLAISQLCLPKSVLADSHQIFDMGGAGPIFGIDTVGDVVIYSPINSCDVNDNPCYFRFRKGEIISFAPAPPQLEYDNGMPCIPTVRGNGNVSVGAYNDGLEAFGATFPLVSGVFTGPDPTCLYGHHRALSQCKDIVEYAILESGQKTWATFGSKHK